jgi:putative protease
LKILAPVDRLEEVDILIEAGADELYAGYVPNEWADEFGFVGSINKRTFASAQFASPGELRQAIQAARSLGKPFFLALNNDFYTSEQMPLVLREVERAVEFGAEALIVADLGLILEVKRGGYRIDLHTSILSAVLNSEAAAFYRDLGVSRVVLDRALTVEDASRIIKAEPELEYEMFMMYGKCPNVEGLCTLFHHNDPDHVWPCGGSCDLMPVPPASDAARDAARAQAGWAETVRGKACGLCGYYELEKAGMTTVKIAGRGRRTEDKVRAVKAIADLRHISLTGAGPADMRDAARDIHRTLFSAECDPFTCYFPDEVQ